MEIVFLTLLSAVSGLLLIFGLLGCVVPVIPGPLLSYVAMLVLIPTRFSPTLAECIVYGLACVVVSVLDYIVPLIGAKKFNCTRWGVAGCVIGTVAGLFLGFWGLIVCPFLGAMLGEIVAGKNLKASFKGGFGAFAGFVAGVLLKVVYCIVCTGWCLWTVFKTLF